MENEFLIKGMVCTRCITVLRKELENNGLTVKEISLGRVRLKDDVGEQRRQQVRALLLGLGFDLLTSRQAELIRQIKETVEEALDNAAQKAEGKMKLSHTLAGRLHMGYSSLNEIFSRSERVTIEQYAIRRRLDKVKALLGRTDGTLTEIAYLTGFSSVHHLSRHFKDLTGLSPSRFRHAVKTAPAPCA